MSKKLTNETFIEKAKQVHGNEYYYSLVEYVNNRTKVKIICKEHGIFEQTPNGHLNGLKCRKCMSDKNSKKQILTNYEFIKKANIVHNNKYDYSKSEYVNTKSKIKIICKEHGEFEQTPNGHLSGKGCSKCGYCDSHIEFKLKTKDIIKKFKSVHDKTFDYSLVNYINAKTPVKIICKEHGEFEQIPNDHLKSPKGCPKCSLYIMTKEQFIIKANAVHDNKYDYSLIEYTISKDKIKIICKYHGEFLQEANAHLQGRNCPLCAKIIFSSKVKYTNDEFIEKANLVHNNKYNYSISEYKNCGTKIKILCPEHGFFEQKPKDHLSGSGCHKCATTFSKAEEEITKWLNKNNIKNIRQYKFDECKGIKKKLPFDFYLPNYNLCIEFDGYQHFHNMYGEKELINIQNRDKIKTEYCKNNNIKLIRIPYWERNSIDKILSQELKIKT